MVSATRWTATLLAVPRGPITSTCSSATAASRTNTTIYLRPLCVARFLVLIPAFSPGGAAVSGELECHQVPRTQRRYESTAEFRCDGAIHADQLSGGLRPGPIAAKAGVEGRGLFWGVVRTQKLRDEPASSGTLSNGIIGGSPGLQPGGVGFQAHGTKIRE